MVYYFYQDISYVIISIIFLLFLVGHMFYYRRFTRGSFHLLGLILMLSTAGLSDLAFRWNPRPIIVLYADALNVFCFVFALAILLHYSLVHFFKSRLWTETKFYWTLYLPALVISALHVLTPLMIAGIFFGPIGFQLSYNAGYWAIVIYGMGFSLLSVFLNLGIIVKDTSPSEKNQSVFLLFTHLLLIYFYSSSLILPFLFNMFNFVSPLPTTFAIIVLAYAYVKYNYFSLETESVPQ
ncbi:MAG: hypothetical protein V3T21_00950 [Candidatus Margulisiibacteriota bacterium]